MGKSPHPTKGESLRWYLSLMLIFMQKTWDTNCFCPKILLIKEYCNLIEQQVHQTTPNQKWHLRCYLSLTILSMRKIDSFRTYWWSKTTAIWLVECISGHNWRTRFSPYMQFLQNHKEHYYAPFSGYKVKSMDYILAKAKKKLFWRNIGLFFKLIILLKIPLHLVLTIKTF